VPEPKYPMRIFSICLLLFFLILSGCGAIFDLLLRNRESEADDAICKERCAGFKDAADYRHCLWSCRSDRSLERGKEKEFAQKLKREKEEKERRETEQFESNRKLSEKIFQDRLK
jgi:hypothetical protein